MMIGAGISLPITLNYFGYSMERLPEHIIFPGVLIGLYTAAIAMIGTWTSLGLLGRWAGRTGGRTRRLGVQILGISIAAWLTLPGAIAFTLAAMKLFGDYLAAKENSKSANREMPDDTPR